MKPTNTAYKYNSVLLIDDSDLDNFINEKMIKTNKFSENIYFGKNGQKALEVVNKLIDSEVVSDEKYLDMMFVDLNMPVMGGFEFIEGFKKIKNELLSKCKIVILTSSINHQDRLYAEKLDPTIVFLNKPLTNDVLNRL